MCILYLSCLFLVVAFSAQPFPSCFLIPPDAVKVLVAEKRDGNPLFMLPIDQVNALFNQGPRVAVVEIFGGISYTWSEFGVYHRLTKDTYPFYQNFFTTFNSIDNGVNEVDFLIWQTTQDMFNYDPDPLKFEFSQHFRGNCTFDYFGAGFPGGCLLPPGATPFTTNNYIQFLNSASYMDNLGFPSVRVYVYSGGNCAATEQRQLIHTRSQNPNSAELEIILSLNSSVNLLDIDFMTCSACVGGKALITNTRNTYAGNFFTSACPEYLVDCNYTCPASTVPLENSLEAQAAYVVDRLSSPEFADFFFQNGIFVIPVFSKKREEFQSIQDFNLNITNCSNLPTVVAFINNFIETTMPGSPLRLTINGCSVETNFPKKAQLLYLLILLVLVPVAIILLVGIKYYLGYNWLSALPYEVSWSFLQYNWSFGAGWSKSGDSDSFYYSKNYSKGSDDYKKASNIFNKFLGGAQLQIKSITAVYNPILLRSFLNAWVLTTERLTNSKGVFGKTTWDTNPNQVWIMEKFKERCNAVSWNKNLVCPIIPTAHGTELFLAEKISQTGFANLSQLDAGFFGSGIYFSTYVMYTLPYFAAKKFPAIIVSYIIPGNVYPVIEHHKGADTLMGKPIQSGYNSHYVLTARSGLCIPEKREGGIFDEIVIPLESQICPAFIFEIKNDNFKELFDDWNRDADDTRGGRDDDARDGEMRVYDI